jgi:hypothetical protein
MARSSDAAMMQYPALVYNRSAETDYIAAMLMMKNCEISFVPYNEFIGKHPDLNGLLGSSLFYRDREVTIYGPALAEFVHERYPAPALIPTTPIDRARLRMATDEVTSWYNKSAEYIQARLIETAEAFTGPRFFFSLAPSTVDFAIAPLLSTAVDNDWRVFRDKDFLEYATRVLTIPAVVAARKLNDIT